MVAVGPVISLMNCSCRRSTVQGAESVSQKRNTYHCLCEVNLHWLIVPGECLLLACQPGVWKDVMQSVVHLQWFNGLRLAQLVMLTCYCCTIGHIHSGILFFKQPIGYSHCNDHSYQTIWIQAKQKGESNGILPQLTFIIPKAPVITARQHMMSWISQCTLYIQYN